MYWGDSAELFQPKLILEEQKTSQGRALAWTKVALVCFPDALISNLVIKFRRQDFGVGKADKS